MAEDDKRKFDIPWATLLPVIAALAGIVAQYRPLVSARPGIPSEKPIEVVAAQDVDARLWQDPLAVAQKAKAQLDADLLAKHVPETRVLGHQIDSLVSRFETRHMSQGARFVAGGNARFRTVYRTRRISFTGAAGRARRTE
jgi:hypothetical protein